MPSLYYGPEAIEESLAATLRTYLPAALDTIYAAAGDTTPKVYPRQVYAGSRDVIPEYPAVVVASIDGQQALDASPSWGEVNHRMDVSGLIVSDDHRTLDRQTKRLLWAIWDVLKTHQGLDNKLSGLAGVQLTRYGRSDVFKPKQGATQLLQVAAWEVIVRVEESTF